MRLVVADTGPIHYLILIDCVDVLPRLWGKVILPAAVQSELVHESAPTPVRRWTLNPPVWIDVVTTPDLTIGAGLHKGEASAIALAVSMSSDLLIMDDRRGVLDAVRKGLSVTGTLGVLDIAAERGMLDFDEAIRRLDGTTFRKPVALLETLLAKHKHR